MDIDQITAILGWATLLNIAVLLYWFIMLAFAKNFVYKLHGRWFDISAENLDVIHYSMMAVFKLLIIVFFIVPYIALRIVL